MRLNGESPRIARILGLFATVVWSSVVLFGWGSPAYATAPPHAVPAKTAPKTASDDGGAVQIQEAPGAARPTAAAARAEAKKLTPDRIATAKKPKGFRYSILRKVWIDEVGQTLLYVKKNKRARTSKAVPIPKDRKLLATLIAGGTLADLKRSTIVTVKFDPAGVVRPQIIIAERATIETLHGKVLDIGGPKLYLALDDHSKRGFAVSAYGDWDAVVQNGVAKDLKRGVAISVRFDPSGEERIQITLDAPPTPAVAKPDQGCGCAVAPTRRGTLPAGAWLLGLGCLAVWWRRRVVASS